MEDSKQIKGVSKTALRRIEECAAVECVSPKRWAYRVAGEVARHVRRTRQWQMKHEEED